MLVGTEAAHALAYRLVFPQSTLRSSILAATGHAYATWLPLVLAIAGAASLVGVGFAAADVARGRRVGELGPAAFALLPPLAFTLQELLELSLHTGHFAVHAFVAPTFLPGLALQLPFAVLAFVAARMLLRAAAALGRLLAREHRVVAIARVVQVCSRTATTQRSACTAAPRGPPLAVGN
jgi:hypothetical protein